MHRITLASLSMDDPLEAQLRDIAKDSALTADQKTGEVEIALSEDVSEVASARLFVDRPTFSNLHLLQSDIDLLNLINAKHEVGGATRTLLTIAAFHAVLSSADPTEAPLNIVGGTWGDLVDAIVGLRRVEFLAIARDCATQAAVHEAASRRQLRGFWSAMYEFYRDNAPA